MADIEAWRLWPGPIVTELEPLEVFFQAEDYHKSYYNRNPEAAYCRIVIEPKLVKLRKEHQALLDS
jgi:peptide-methionine (S)-S-oxide reductase